MVLDVPNISESDEDEEADELATDLDYNHANGRRRGLGRLHISHLLQMVLQDAQTRLFFKAQSVIQAEIRNYIPKPEDLAYPEKLVGKLYPPCAEIIMPTVQAAARNPLSGSGYQITEKKDSLSQVFQLKSLDKQDTWFPTLQKTIWVLSQLHDFVKVCPSLLYPDCNCSVHAFISPQSLKTLPRKL
jgi:conserved oligomeric Golgi complex subunit 3